jgi:hypothetical protein
VALGQPQPKPERISTHKLLGLIDQLIAALEDQQKPGGKIP